MAVGAGGSEKPGCQCPSWDRGLWGWNCREGTQKGRADERGS